MFVNLSDTIERIKFDFHEDNQNDFFITVQTEWKCYFKVQMNFVKIKACHSEFR